MDATQIILIVFIVVLLIAYPVMMYSRNKKETQRMQEQTNSLKRGDKVLTTSGVYGTIVDMQLENDKKIITIETGTEKKKGYISVDAYAIYSVFPEEDKTEPKTEPVNEASANQPQRAEEVKEESLESVPVEAQKQEEATKKNSKKKN